MKSEICALEQLFIEWQLHISLHILIVSVQGWQNTAEIFLMGYRLLSTQFEIRNEINKQLSTQYGMDATYWCSLFQLRF